jgi:FkbM family methyltransferase
MELIRTARHRLRHAPSLVRREINALIEELRLIARIRNGHCVFRQSQVDGMRALVKANENVGDWMYFCGEFEADDSSCVFDRIRESDICVDIGANVGFYTMGLAKRASRGTVHSFEPVPLNYHVLAVNVLANRLSNVVVNNCAVGDRNGEVDFCIAGDGAYSSLVDTGRKAIVETIKSRIVTLDSYADAHNLPRVDILKVDVEGAEPVVLRGSSALLSDPERRPRLILLELLDCMLRLFGSTIREVDLLMRRYGYDPFAVVEGELVPLSERHYNQSENILFIDTRKEQLSIVRS